MSKNSPFPALESQEWRNIEEHYYRWNIKESISSGCKSLSLFRNRIGITYHQYKYNSYNDIDIIYATIGDIEAPSRNKPPITI